MNETNDKKHTVKQYERKLVKLEGRLSEIEKKISHLEAERKRIKGEISVCRDEQILHMVKNSKLTVEQICQSIQLAQSINQAGKTDIEILTAENNQMEE